MTQVKTAPLNGSDYYALRCADAVTAIWHIGSSERRWSKFAGAHLQSERAAYASNGALGACDPRLPEATGLCAGHQPQSGGCVPALGRQYEGLKPEHQMATWCAESQGQWRQCSGKALILD